MTTFTREDLVSIADYRGISTEGDLAAFALSLMNRAETAERAARHWFKEANDSHNAIVKELEAERDEARRELAEAEEAIRKYLPDLSQHDEDCERFYDDFDPTPCTCYLSHPAVLRARSRKP